MSIQSPFISVGEVCVRLGVNRSTLHGVYEFLPFLYLEKSKTRFFPKIYIDDYVAWLRANKRRAGRRSAQDYSQTAEAKEVMATANATIVALFKAHAWLTRQDVMDLMNVANGTITKWQVGKIITPIREEAPIRRGRGEAWLPVAHYSSAELLGNLKWRCPKSLRPNR